MYDPPRRGRPEAAAAIWRRASGGRASAESAARPWLRGALRLGAAVAVAALLLALGRPVIASLVVCLGLGSLLLALLAPAVLRAGERRLRRAVGLVLGMVLLAPVFYLVLTPAGLLTRRGRHDRLARRPSPDLPTYWRGRERGRYLERPY